MIVTLHIHRFYSVERQRRRSSIEKVINELEDFKIEIVRRFARSKFNHTYVFPRIGDDNKQVTINKLSQKEISRNIIEDRYRKWMSQYNQPKDYAHSKKFKSHYL